MLPLLLYFRINCFRRNDFDCHIIAILYIRFFKHSLDKCTKIFTKMLYFQKIFKKKYCYPGYFIYPEQQYSTISYES